jgi:hypothetical protein
VQERTAVLCSAKQHSKQQTDAAAALACESLYVFCICARIWGGTSSLPRAASRLWEGCSATKGAEGHRGSS